MSLNFIFVVCAAVTENGLYQALKPLQRALVAGELPSVPRTTFPGRARLFAEEMTEGTLWRS